MDNIAAANCIHINKNETKVINYKVSANLFYWIICCCYRGSKDNEKQVLKTAVFR